MAYETDFLVIGSGISGLSFALKAARLGRVTLVTKKKRADSATNLAQGGIAVVLSNEDNFEDHVHDTLVSGAGLCHEDVVRMVVRHGPERIAELVRMGVRFEEDPAHPGQLDLGREGGHSTRRIAHASDFTGREIERGLLERAAENPAITMLEDHLAVDLLVGSRAGMSVDGESCLGAYVMAPDNTISPFLAKVTMLCTGGAGKVYLYTTNPDIATGDGVAMAFRAGARVANLEFVQFHPTCLFHPRAKNFLISEAVRGEGARLVDERGHAFMASYDPRGDLATRDTVARALDAEMKKSGDDCVYLDITHKSSEFLQKRFPNIYGKCISLGIDMARDPIPVVPAAHYLCGGVVTDVMGRTNIAGLYALGETSSTGLHGGNRLASNSLLEGVVFAHQAFVQCERDWPGLARRPHPAAPAWATGSARRMEECVLISYNWDQIRRLMWNYVGIVRTDKRLALARERMGVLLAEIRRHYQEYLLTPDLVELRNIAQVADLIIQCAITRKESRGLHYMADYPEKDDAHFSKDTILSRR